MDITYQIDLSGYFPKEIMGLHQAGVLTLEEIIASGRIHSCFGPELGDYVYKQLKLQEKSLQAQLVDTVITETAAI